jgi:hypothetical protein
MKNIRNGVFETNSSSTHSISISSNSDGILETLPVSKKGFVHLSGGEFGWEERQYNDAETKANYCAVDTMDARFMHHRALLIKVICEHTGAKGVSFDFTNDYENKKFPQAYIDHQSCGTSHSAFVTEASLKQFIFDRSSTLTTDNDNH